MAIIENDEILQAFLEESREHLSGIENDLLAIEEAGANIDHDLVNKVFRAMHSIKGGAGFLGLNAVKSLAHAAEDLLNKVRNAELVPNSVVISSLLDAADFVNRLLNQPKDAPELDIEAPLAALHDALAPSVASGSPPVTPAAAPVEAQSPAPSPSALDGLLSTHRDTMAEKRLAGQRIFVLDCDLLSGQAQQQTSPAAVFHDLGSIGQVIDARVDLLALEDLNAATDVLRLPVQILFSTLMDKDMLISFANLSAEQAREIPPPAPELSAPVAALSSPTQVVPPPPATDTPAPVTPPSSTGEAAPRKPAAPADDQAKISADSSLRVNVKILDNLMTMAGELVLTRNQFLQIVHSRSRQDFDTVSQRLDLVTSELQEAIMSTRMQPVGNVFNKFKRVVRDLAQKLGKEIELMVEGGEVEMDKTIIEALADPLTHLVRNSVDHGIELPDKRAQTGKPRTGTLQIKAFHEGGQVIIEIADDGAGIDTARLREKALSMGTHDKSQLDAMQEHELLRLIFLPGLSTAREVTEVSGRGVGMDVVHANLSKVGGVFDIASKIGKGTTITIKLPLTLAIIPSLIVSVAGERFAIPQVNMVELVRVPAALVKERIERIGSAMLMRLRGELLPLISLNEALGIEERRYHDQQLQQDKPCRRQRLDDRRGLTSPEPAVPEATPAAGGAIPPGSVQSNSNLDQRQGRDRRSSPHSAVNILVVSVGKFHYGLIVDTLLDSEEIVVKPLGSHLRKCQVYAGATIQGDGRVALILDVVGISKVMNLSSVADRVRGKGQQEAGGVSLDAQALLIVRNSPQEQLAIPLGLISRIEKINRGQIEITGGRRNMQYRGSTLPLFSIDEAAQVAPLNEQSSHLNVVVFPFGEREIGIMVSEIVDIITVPIAIDDTTHKQPGIMGSAIIMEQITLLVDLFGVVATVKPEWIKFTMLASSASGVGQQILVVEDSKFFNNQLCDFISAVGYKSFSAMDGLEGLAILEREHIDLVLTDIEMPNMDGLEFTTRIRGDARWAGLPVIAVTSLSGEAAEKRGRKAGVNEYMIKLDREKIIQTINRYLKP